jgi:hypothetical protein
VATGVKQGLTSDTTYRPTCRRAHKAIRKNTNEDWIASPQVRRATKPSDDVIHPEQKML